MRKETIGFLQIIIAAALMGFVVVLVRFAQNLNTQNLTFFRVLVAAIFLFLFIKATKTKIAPFKKERRKLLLFSGLHGFTILGYFFAIENISVASAVLLLYSSSIWIVLFSRFVLKEKLEKRAIVALIVALTGTVILLFPQELTTSTGLLRSSFGYMVGLISGASMGLIYILSKTFKTYDKVSLTFWQNLLAIPLVAPLLINNTPVFTQTDILIVLCLGCFCTAIPHTLIYKGFEKVNAQKGAVIILLDIVFALLFAVMFLRELPTLNEVIGGILIVLGSYLIIKKK